MMHFRLQRLNLMRALKRAPPSLSKVQKLRLRTRWGPGKSAMARKQGQAHVGPSVTSAGKNLSVGRNLKIHISGSSSLPKA